MVGFPSPRRSGASGGCARGAVTAIAEQPGLGPVYSRDPRYRAWRLKGMPYLLFYRADAAADTIWIVAAWSAMRGTRPELP